MSNRLTGAVYCGQYGLMAMTRPLQQEGGER